MAFEESRPCVGCEDKHCMEITCEKLREWQKKKTEYYRQLGLVRETNE